MDRNRPSLALFLALAALPLAVYGIGRQFVSSSDVAAIAFAVTADLTPNIHAALGSGRYVYLTTAALLVTANVTATAGVLVLARRMFDVRLRTAAVITIALVSGVLAYTLFQRSGKVEASGQLVTAFGAAANQAFAALVVSPGDTPKTVGQWQPGFHAFVSSMIAMGAMSLAALAAGLFVSFRRTDMDEKAVVEALKCLRLVLYAGGIVLALSVVYGLVRDLWPLPLLDVKHHAAYKELAVGLASLNGVVYVAVLAAIYLPSYAAAQSCIGNHIDQQDLDSDVDARQWAIDKGLHVSFGAGFTQILAAISPLIAGPAFGSLVGLLEKF